MTVIDRDTASPFRTTLDTGLTDEQSPPVNEETMRRLRNPFAPQPAPGTPHPQHTAALKHNDPPDEYPNLRRRGSADRG